MMDHRVTGRGGGGEAPFKIRGRGRNGAESLSETPPQMQLRVKTPLSPSKMMGRGRNGGEGFADGPQGDREGWNGDEAPFKIRGRGQKGAESLSETPPQMKLRVKTPLSDRRGGGEMGWRASLMDPWVTGRGGGG